MHMVSKPGRAPEPNTYAYILILMFMSKQTLNLCFRWRSAHSWLTLTMPQMRAVLVKDGKGGFENLFLGLDETPKLSPNQVLVKVGIRIRRTHLDDGWIDLTCWWASRSLFSYLYFYDYHEFWRSYDDVLISDGCRSKHSGWIEWIFHNAKANTLFPQELRKFLVLSFLDTFLSLDLVWLLGVLAMKSSGWQQE